MNFKKTSVASSIAFATLALVACGGDSGSQDSGSTSSTSFTGLVVDGRIANGFVWVDLNNNGEWDSVEPKAYTDADGYYSYNYERLYDYCSTSSANYNERYCLDSSKLVGYGRVRITGGTEVSTGERFLGSMVSVVYTGSKSTGVDGTESSTYENIYHFFNPVIIRPSITDPYSSITPTTTLVDVVMSNNISTTPETAVRSSLGLGSLSNTHLYSSQIVAPVTTTSNYTVDSSRAKLQLAGQSVLGLANNITTRANTSSNTTDSQKVLSEILKVNTLSNSTSSIFDTNESGLNTVLSNVGVSDSSSTSNDVTILKQGLTLRKDLVGSIDDDSDVNEIKASQTLAAVIAETEKKVVKLLASSSNSSTQFANSQNTLNAISNNLETIKTQIKTQQTASTPKVVVIEELATKLETVDSSSGSSDLETAVSESSVEEADSGIWVTHYLAMSGKDDNDTAGTSDDKEGRAIMFFKGEAGDTSGDAIVCYALYDGEETEDDRKRVGLLSAGWTAIPGQNVVDINSQYGDFQIRATGKLAPDDDTENGDYFLGFGGTNTTDKTYGRFTFKSDEFDQDAVWFSDHLSVTTGDNASYEQWGLRALPSGSSVPSKTADCTVALDGGNTILTNLENFDESDFSTN